MRPSAGAQGETSYFAVPSSPVETMTHRGEATKLPLLPKLLLLISEFADELDKISCRVAGVSRLGAGG